MDDGNEMVWRLAGILEDYEQGSFIYYVTQITDFSDPQRGVCFKFSIKKISIFELKILEPPPRTKTHINLAAWLELWKIN